MVLISPSCHSGLLCCCCCCRSVLSCLVLVLVLLHSHMAPEVLRSGKISVASDIYAYGILMYELYTGQVSGVWDDMCV